MSTKDIYTQLNRGLEGKALPAMWETRVQFNS